MYQDFVRDRSSVWYFRHLTVGLHTFYLLFFLEVVLQTGYSSHLALSLLKKEDVTCKICSTKNSQNILERKKNEPFQKEI